MFSFAISAVLLVAAVATSLVTLVLLAEVLAALWPWRSESPPLVAPRLVVLIPAHNEAEVLAGTLRTLLPTVPAGGRVLVVADNCRDATAAIARECGAEVIERSDSQRRGKGYALDFGLKHLAADPPEAVVFVDADCRVRPDTVLRLAAAAATTGRPVQGLNLCDPDPNGGSLQIVSGFAFRFKNLVRALGLSRLCGTTHLTGTGMALPWKLLQTVDLASGNLVEDMQLSIDLLLRGERTLFLPSARIDSPLPQQAAAARTQRTRWEHGQVRTFRREAPRLAWQGLIRGRWDLLCLAADLTAPPLALFVHSLLFWTVVSALAALCGASPWPLAVLLAAGMVLALAVGLGWFAYCRREAPWRALAWAPVYALSKLPIYLGLLGRGKTEWVRTERDPAK